jgi:hypothetical protein
VLARDGTIKELKLQDLTGDKQPELIVIMDMQNLIFMGHFGS